MSSQGFSKGERTVISAKSVAGTSATGFLAALFAAIVILPGFSTGASAQGLLQILFGKPRPAYQQRTYAPPPSYHQRRARRPDYSQQRRSRPRRARAPRNVSVAKKPAGPKVYTPPPVLSGPYGRFRADPTLRKGDVLVTSNGLVVFVGKRGTKHSVKDFVPLSKGKRYARGNRERLQAIADANTFGLKDLVETRIVSDYKDKVKALIEEQKNADNKSAKKRKGKRAKVARR